MKDSAGTSIENPDYDKDNLDQNAYTVGAIGKAGEMTWGAFVTSVTKSKVRGDDAVDGTSNMSGFVKTKVGNIAVSGEYTKIDKATGLVAMATMPMGSISITGAVVTTSDGFMADSDFKPFGGLDDTFKVYNNFRYKTNASGEDVFGDNTAFGVNVEMPLAGMKAVVGFASAKIGSAKDGGDEDITATIIHTKITKSLGKQTSVYGKYGMVTTNSGSDATKAGSAMSAGRKVKF
jgi:hypothetical protein